MAKPTKKPAPKKPAAKAAPRKPMQITIRNVSNDEVREVPLNQLLPPATNVRRKMDTRTIAELQSSIPHMGILSALTVVKQGAKYQVINGAHRLAALNNLAGAGAISKTYAVPCVVKPGSIDATEAGLAENTIRAAMDPLDECDAFKKLLDTDKKLTVADVAQRFGVTETVVNKRLTLAGMPAKIAKAYRDERINLEQLQAFAATDDLKKRAAVFDTLDKRDDWGFLRSDRIRRLLTENEIKADDNRVRFVGIDAYQQAGGALRRDLFNDDNDGTVILDATLLNQLVQDKLTAESERLKAEGWGWVIVKSSYVSYDDTKDYDRIASKKQALSPADAKTLKDLEETIAKINELEEKRDEGLTDAEDARRDRYQEQVDALEAKKITWSDKDKARSGVIVGINHGALDREYALVNKKDELKRQKAAAADKAVKEGKTLSAADTDDGTVPKRILEDLTIHRASALASKLSQSPLVALQALVYTWTLEHFYVDGTLDRICLAVSRSDKFARLGDSAGPHVGYNQLLEKRAIWLGRLPEHEHEVWDWCFTQSQDTHLRLLAYLVANSLDDINVTGSSQRFAIRLAHVLQLDMTHFYTANADNLFGHLPKPALASIIREVEDRALTADEQKMKKAQLAAVVDKAVAGKQWLPPQLRPKPVEPENPLGQDRGDLDDNQEAHQHDEEDQDDEA